MKSNRIAMFVFDVRRLRFFVHKCFLPEVLAEQHQKIMKILHCLGLIGYTMV